METNKTQKIKKRNETKKKLIPNYNINRRKINDNSEAKKGQVKKNLIDFSY